MRASTRAVRAILMAAAVAATALVVVPTAVAAGAAPGSRSAKAPASGCGGQATSYDSKGRILDKATAPGAGGTSSDPLHVDIKGSISWKGSTTGVLQNGSYKVTASGFTVKSGSFKNDKGNQSWQGVENVGKRLDSIPVLGWLTKKLDPTATVKVKYTVTGQQGVCSGSVVLKIGDSPTFTPLWVTAVVLFGLAFFMLFWPARFFGG